MICPDCNGAKKNKVFACPPGAWREIDCSLCDGSGEISVSQAEWIEHGKFIRQERLHRNLSLREEADRLGISPYLLSQMERGKVESRSTPYALDGAFCACKIFIPSYESTAVKCRNCGKPPPASNTTVRQRSDTPEEQERGCRSLLSNGARDTFRCSRKEIKCRKLKQ